MAKFQWDENKRSKNIEKHEIDFIDVCEIFSNYYHSHRSDRRGEVRWTAVGEMNGRIIAVAFTVRDEAIRIISARKAYRNEERAYHASVRRRSG